LLPVSAAMTICSALALAALGWSAVTPVKVGFARLRSMRPT
jgi:hypothetical protein